MKAHIYIGNSASALCSGMEKVDVGGGNVRLVWFESSRAEAEPVDDGSEPCPDCFRRARLDYYIGTRALHDLISRLFPLAGLYNSLRLS